MFEFENRMLLFTNPVVVQSIDYGETFMNNVVPLAVVQIA